jgi:hypothetical protein
MSKYSHIITILCVLVIGALAVQAEKSTELYIPVGQSPGLSNQYTVTGTIERVNPADQSIRMTAPSGDSYTVKLTEHSLIYLDRTKAQLSNSYGTLADCEAGDTAEVKFVDNSRTRPIEWIKIKKAD